MAGKGNSIHLAGVGGALRIFHNLDHIVLHDLSRLGGKRLFHPDRRLRRLRHPQVRLYHISLVDKRGIDRRQMQRIDQQLPLSVSTVRQLYL